MNKWKMYDELIDAVPDNLKVEYAFVSPHWIGVKSELGTGLAMRMADCPIKTKLTGGMKGMSLKELASYSKSWDFHEASLGIAAINSFFNGFEKNKSLVEKTPDDEKNKSVFELISEKVAGKKVTVVGHFPRITRLSEICELSVLERKPQESDFPDPACEYILPHQDFLFTTAVTLINKTYPRLAELAERAEIYIVGPSSPLTDIMFKYGASFLAGSVVMNDIAVRDLFMEGAILQKVSQYIAFVRKEK